MPTEGSCILSTDSGMHVLWAPFANVHDYDTWDNELGEDADIQRHVVAGNLVPINIGSDGAFAFVVRVGAGSEPARLSERETQYLTVSSQPHLLTTHGEVVLSGIEHVADQVGEGWTKTVPLAPGRHSVTVHLVDWQAEPDATNPDGTPADHALPDFVILINPADPATQHRTNITTFDPPK